MEEERELQKIKLRVVGFKINCPTLAYGKCKASYGLENIPDREYMERDHSNEPLNYFS